MDKLIKIIFPLNPMDDGTCRTLKSQYQQTSTANFVRHSGGYAATGVNHETIRDICKGRRIPRRIKFIFKFKEDAK